MEEKQEQERRITRRDPESGDLITTVTYNPNGVDHVLQRAITDRMHELVMAEGKFTLAELGYLHINTLTYDQTSGALMLRIYFDAHLAARTFYSPVNGSKSILPLEYLNIFSGHFFYGNVNNVFSFEKIRAPEIDVYGDEAGHPSVFIHENGKFKETNTLVLHCNVPLALASINNISLNDPNYSFHIDNTVTKGTKKAVKAVVTDLNSREVPVGVSITFTENYGADYDPDDAEDFLRGLATRMVKAKDNQRKLDEKVRKKSKKAKKDRDRKARDNSAYSKYA